jgi:hypothetical protein
VGSATGTAARGPTTRIGKATGSLIASFICGLGSIVAFTGISLGVVGLSR